MIHLLFLLFSEKITSQALYTSSDVSCTLNIHMSIVGHFMPKPDLSSFDLSAVSLIMLFALQ